jgi:hypothetical protein
MAALLDLVRKLIDYGKELTATLHQRAADTPHFALIHFATDDLALILARISRGLLRAQALEQRLARACGRARPDHRARPERQPAPPARPAPRAARPAAHQAPGIAPADCPFANMPTAEQIAAADRRRPIGAVIADICRDLNILPSHPLFREVMRAIVMHGGNYARMVMDQLRRMFPYHNEPEPRWLLPSPAPAATGPP